MKVFDMHVCIPLYLWNRSALLNRARISHAHMAGQNKAFAWGSLIYMARSPPFPFRRPLTQRTGQGREGEMRALSPNSNTNQFQCAQAKRRDDYHAFPHLHFLMCRAWRSLICMSAYPCTCEIDLPFWTGLEFLTPIWQGKTRHLPGAHWSIWQDRPPFHVPQRCCLTSFKRNLLKTRRHGKKKPAAG